MRESPRVRRLRTDLKSLEQLQADSSILSFTVAGSPPESYAVKFRGRGLSQPDGKTIQVRNTHEVRIDLGASYPRLMPEMAWKTPIFHPNISGGGVVCLGGYGTYWVPSLNLDELCEMLWDMIRYQNYDTESPYNRDAANWAKAQRQFQLPLDPRPIRDRVASGTSPAAGAVPASAQAAPAQAEHDIMFLDDEIVEAEIIEPDDPDIMIIE